MRLFVVILEDGAEKVTSGKWFEAKDEDKEKILEIMRKEENEDDRRLSI